MAKDKAAKKGKRGEQPAAAPAAPRQITVTIVVPAGPANMGTESYLSGNEISHWTAKGKYLALEALDAIAKNIRQTERVGDLVEYFDIVIVRRGT